MIIYFSLPFIPLCSLSEKRLQCKTTVLVIRDDAYFIDFVKISEKSNNCRFSGTEAPATHDIDYTINL